VLYLKQVEGVDPKILLIQGRKLKMKYVCNGEGWYDAYADACDIENETHYSDYLDFRDDYSPKTFKTAIEAICEVEEILAEYEDFIDESSVECLVICEALEDYPIASLDTLSKLARNIRFSGATVEFDDGSILLRVYG